MLDRELRPDVVLMDLRMPHTDGVEATRPLREQLPGIKVIVLTTYDGDRSVVEALRAGARGYLTKDTGGAEISRALHDVLQERAVIDPAVQHHVVDAIASTTPTPGARPPARRCPAASPPGEAEVLTLVAGGLTDTEIAEKLVVSEATVKSHINHLLPKINARDRAQAVSFAYRNGLVPPRQPGQDADGS